MMDYTTDKNPTYIYKVLEVLEDKIPAHIVSAEIPDKADLQAMSKHAFADTTNRLFPCYDEATTFLSACNIFGAGVKNDTVIDVLEKRAAFLGIEELVSEIKNLYTPQIEKSASNPQNFALVFEEDGVETGFLPLNDILDIDHSCEEWKNARNHAKLPSDLLKQAAEAIVEAAEKFDALESVPAIIKSAAEKRLVDFSQIPSQINFRVNSVTDEEGKELYIKMACDLSEDNVTEWAEVLDLLDHALLTPEIRRHDMFKTAAETVYSGITVQELEKVANSHLTVEINGQSLLLPHSDLQKFSDEELFKFYPKTTAELLKEAKHAENAIVATSVFDKIDDIDKIDFLSDLKDRV